MRRAVVAVLSVAAAFAAGLATAGAKGHPWCLIAQDMGDGWACAFDTFAQCEIEARAGNTGFCAASPFEQEAARPASKPSRQKRKTPSR
jgi:hypothetical protein